MWRKGCPDLRYARRAQAPQRSRHQSAACIGIGDFREAPQAAPDALVPGGVSSQTSPLPEPWPLDQGGGFHRQRFARLPAGETTTARHPQPRLRSRRPGGSAGRSGLPSGCTGWRRGPSWPGSNRQQRFFWGVLDRRSATVAFVDGAAAGPAGYLPGIWPGPA